MSGNFPATKNRPYHGSTAQNNERPGSSGRPPFADGDILRLPAEDTEEALRGSQEFTSSLLENAPNAIVVINPDTSIRYVNPAFERINGWTLEEIAGIKAPYPWWPEEEREELSAGFKLAMEQGSGQAEVIAQKKNGERYWIDINWSSVKHDGKLQYLIVNSVDVTERKLAMEALRQSEERFSKAFHASPDSIAISRIEDGTFLEVNESFLRDKGYTRQEIIGRSSIDLGIWPDLEARNRIIRMLKEHGSVHNQQVEFRTKSGEIHTSILSAELITLGDEPCMISLSTDVTQRRQSEAQVRLLGSVTQQVSDATIVTDPDFRITYINQAARDLFGYSAEEALGKHISILDARPLKKSRLQKIVRTVSSGKIWSGTVTKKRQDGSTLLCDCRLSPLYDENGKISSYIEVTRDVTEQKEVEAKLQVHKQLIESILANMPGGVLVIDRHDRVILANKAFHKIFHLSSQAVHHKLLDEIIPKDQLLKLYKAVQSGETADNTLEFRYQVDDLEKIIVGTVIKMDGERTLLTFTDISREREEEEKLYLTDRLASIGEMAAGLAHELNNPLTGVMALSQLLLKSDITEEYREDLECVYDEAKRAASIVKNVLLFARNNNYENGRASVNEVIRDILRLREYEAKVGNIKVVTNLREDLPPVPVDKFQMEQAFLNIVLNAEAAIKETGRPGTLTVTTEAANNHINIHFHDNGCGIKKHVLPRIFDPFFTTKEIGKGTGLGLSICYGIVVKHGGKISVKSQVNRGTTFTIRMPAAPSTTAMESSIPGD